MDRRVIASGGSRSTRRRPRSVAWATVKAFDAVDGPARRDPKGGGYRTTGVVEALARCADIAPRAFPSLSCDSHRAAPVHGEKSGLEHYPANSTIRPANASENSIIRN